MKTKILGILVMTLLIETAFSVNGYVELNDIKFNITIDIGIASSLTNADYGVNQPPNKPSAPSGPANGRAGTTYTYTSSTTDPDDDQIFYLFYWGDERSSGWIGPYDSGEECSTSYMWDNWGYYHTAVSAKDEHGAQSLWSEPLLVRMPKNKAINTPLLHFLENHQYMFPLLRQLLKL